MFPFIDTFIYLDHDLSEIVKDETSVCKINNGYYGDILKAISDNKKWIFLLLPCFVSKYPLSNFLGKTPHVVRFYSDILKKWPRV